MSERFGQGSGDFLAFRQSRVMDEPLTITMNEILGWLNYGDLKIHKKF